MALRLSIFLPQESIDTMDLFEEFVTNIGDLVSQKYGNEVPGEEFDLEDLISYIIINEENSPKIENLAIEDCILVIPVKDKK